MKYIYSILITVIGFAIFSLQAQAASLYMEPADGFYGQGDSFSVTLRLDPTEECINAATISLKYPQNSIKVVDVGVAATYGPKLIFQAEVRPEIPKADFSKKSPAQFMIIQNSPKLKILETTGHTYVVEIP